MNNNIETRTETDSMGSIQVNNKNYWGAQTQRSLLHFSIGEDIIPHEVIKAMGILKKAAANANNELGILSDDKNVL